MIDERSLPYFETLRRMGEYQEEHWEQYILPFEDALTFFSSLRQMVPESVAFDEEQRNADGFSELLKLLALIRV